NWLKDFVQLPKNLDPKDLGNELTLKTAEVEQVLNQEEQFANMVAGQVLELKKHPDADALQVAKVSVGDKAVQIVCGGSNLKEGMYVAVTLPGALVRWHGEGDLVSVKDTKIRGVESCGMIAAPNEIGLPELQKGPKDILDLSDQKPKPGTPLSELLDRKDTILEFDNKSLTHRPDLWGHMGIAREVSAITGAKFTPINPQPGIPPKGESVEVEVKDSELCPRYCGLIINNIKVEDSPDWLKNRLRAVGHGIHNNIVDVTNYVVAELGQPMHAFDKDYIKKGIVARRAKSKEVIITLDDKKRELDDSMLVIADHEKALALAGIMGGQNSEIKPETTSIILESANFNAGNIRRTSTKLGLRTDAVQRFEKAIDPELAMLAMLRAAELILKICPGAKLGGPITDINNVNKKPVVITLNAEKTASKIGVNLSAHEMKELLSRLEFEVEKKSDNTLKVSVPSWRATKDISIEDDLVEEIARLYGYENIEADLPKLPTKLPMENVERFKKHRLRELLSFGLGFDEVYNYSFYGKTEMQRCLLQEEGHIKLENFLSEDQTHLRMSMTPNLLKCLRENVKSFDDCRLYEIGRTYKEIGEYFPLEEKKVVGLICLKGKSDSPFYEAKGAAEEILKKFGPSKFKASKGVEATPYAHPGKSLSYLGPNGQTLAKVFILHPAVERNHELETHSIAIFAVNFSILMKLEPEELKFSPLAKFPGIEIDISVVVDRDLEVEKVKNAILSADQKLITQAALFDLYQGDNIDKDKKAVAYKITLQSDDRTLTDEDMTQAQSKIFKNLEKIGGTIRGK
ncbi:phenylalanine--tRNA ligase subunit beta, partial [Candidatus Peregrinibacteria bacterium]|nr:phenylalanine--tRNA ligase subunit beta [Candidatus Peregrinibacteria bacterium]